MSKWEKHVTHAFVQVVGEKTLEQEQDNASGRAVPDSRSLEVTLWVMGTNPSTSLGRQPVT